MKGNNTQNIYSMSPEDKTVPVFPGDPVRTQQWKDLMALVEKHNMYKHGVIKAGRTFGPPAVMKLIKDITGENDLRKEKKLGKINVSATFRQRIRRWNSTEAEEANQAVQEVYRAEVKASYEAGYRPVSEKLLDGVAELVTSDDDDDEMYTGKELAIAGRFLKSLSLTK